jgi:hypothetical protein
MAEWRLISLEFKSWTLTEVQQMSQRERKNWIEVSRIKV